MGVLLTDNLPICGGSGVTLMDGGRLVSITSENGSAGEEPGPTPARIDSDSPSSKRAEWLL